MASNLGVRKLTLRERTFVDALASDPSSPTFGKAVRAALAIQGKENVSATSKEYAIANQLAVKLMKKDHIQSEIDRVFAAHKLTLSDRSSALSDILHTPKSITIHTTKDSEGKITSVQEIIHSSAAERIKAIDVLNRMDGVYSKAVNVSQLQARVLQPMLDYYSKQMRKALSSQELPPDADSEATTHDSESVDSMTHDVADAEQANAEEQDTIAVIPSVETGPEEGVGGTPGGGSSD